MTLTFHVRPANVNDVDAMLKLVRDLATYEKEPESARATPALFRENIFEKKYAHTLLAFDGTPEAPGIALGMALYFFNFSTWTGKPGLFLEDLYVSPHARNQGIGKALFAELGKIAQEKDCARLDWSVLKWNTPSIAFYENKLEAKGMEEWMGMRLEEQGIENLQKLVVHAA
ncbi:acyl-CoA N-acyltransferase [Suillus subalutaceus]|uniref:acyl-CoA N-acyltransferase n=1 Tax=Suillus subalutaceus TaxID=48586 RepID=UPI001B861212|nr:acyl-CoA N-acyltransferase [Suillus subalutaceus]KAG1862126.1 acyl-CoA N-acyltransferase [Suillus subalutaceus]